MKHIIALFAILTLSLAACSDTEKIAREELDNARTLYERNDLESAKVAIDSLRARYPKEFKVLKEGLTLMRMVEMREAERNIIFCDSLLPIRTAEAEELTKAFLFEKDEEYDVIGKYIWKQQTIERNVERSYIRSGVDEKGEMYLASVYFGASALKHTGIKVSTNDGEFAETATIPYDGGLNYRFEDMGNTTEVVTYKGENGMDAIKFLYDNADKRLRIDYNGGRAYHIFMADADKKALSATYDLAIILSDIEKMKTEKEKSEKKIAYLKDKLTDEQS